MFGLGGERPRLEFEPKRGRSRESLPRGYMAAVAMPYAMKFRRWYRADRALDAHPPTRHVVYDKPDGGGAVSDGASAEQEVPRAKRSVPSPRRGLGRTGSWALRTGQERTGGLVGVIGIVVIVAPVSALAGRVGASGSVVRAVSGRRAALFGLRRSRGYARRGAR